MKEIEVVEIHAHNLFLGIETLQLDGYHPLDRLLQESFMHALRLLGIELLGQLLRNGTAASSALATQDTALDDGTQQGTEIHPTVLVETNILGGHQRLNYCGREVIVAHKDAVCLTVAPCTQQLAIGREYL